MDSTSPTLAIFIFFAALILFAIFWHTICRLIAKDGWQKFSSKSVSWVPAFEKSFTCPFVRFNESTLARYNNAVRAMFTNEGIYLHVLIFFIPSHPALLIPWKNVEGIKEISGWRFKQALVIRDEDNAIYVALSKSALNEYTRFKNTPNLT